jgi:hypothetical protein
MTIYIYTYCRKYDMYILCILCIVIRVIYQPVYTHMYSIDERSVTPARLGEAHLQVVDHVLAHRLALDPLEPVAGRGHVSLSDDLDRWHPSDRPFRCPGLRLGRRAERADHEGGGERRQPAQPAPLGGGAGAG